VRAAQSLSLMPMLGELKTVGIPPVASRGHGDTWSADCHRQVRDGLLEYPAQFPERPKEEDAPALRALNDSNVALGAVTNYGVLAVRAKPFPSFPSFASRSVVSKTDLISLAGRNSPTE